MSGYIWAIIGIILIFVEVLTTAFVAVFFGIGALITALLVYLKIATGFEVQVIIFSTVSIISVMLFRNIAKHLFGIKAEKNYSEYAGDKAVVEEAIEPNKEGKVLYRGTIWIAYSSEDKRFEKGDTVIIEEVDGIKLRVKSLK